MTQRFDIDGERLRCGLTRFLRAPRRRARRSAALVVVTFAAGALAWAAPASATTSNHTRSTAATSAHSRPHANTVPTVPVGGDPIGVAVNQATNTVYVANMNDNTVSVIDGTTCSALNDSACAKTAPTIAVGSGPLGVAVDQATDTVYVANINDNTVSVIDGATCNATVTTGCGQTAKTVPVGIGPNVLAVDQATDTVYVANGGAATVSVIDGATCNATVTSGCSTTPPTTHVGYVPQGLAVDQSTDTIYVTNGYDNTVSVVDGATCNSTVTSGCGAAAPTVAVGGSPDGATIDDASHTLYVIYAGPSLGAVAMIDTAKCNRIVITGCSQTPATVQAGSGPIWVAENPVTRTVYVANQEDSNVSVINAATCNAHRQSGCATPLPAIAAAFTAGAIDVDVATDTVYYSSQDDDVVSVLNGATCNANDSRGCTTYAPTTTVGAAPQGIAVNAATDTVYVGNRGDDTLSVINGATCNAFSRSGCGQNWPTVATGSTPQAVAVDQRTDTVYTANTDPDTGTGNTVSVIDGAHCNARTTSGCRHAPATVVVGTAPVALAVNNVTDTIYVTNANYGGAGSVSVINGNTCNSAVTTGCDQTPATIAVGTNPEGVAIDPATDTIYVTNANYGGAGSVSVINGNTCNSAVTTGCDQTPATIAVGNSPQGVAIDLATDTLYAENTSDNTVSVINTAICNAKVMSGCGQTPPTMATGAAPFVGVAVDQLTDSVVLGAVGDSDVDVFNGATCNRSVTSGCGQKPVAIPTGGWPTNVAVNPLTDTVYAPDNVDGQVSFFAEATCLGSGLRCLTAGPRLSAPGW
jgi:YVTN family beta-propeller protein